MIGTFIAFYIAQWLHQYFFDQKHTRQTFLTSCKDFFGNLCTKYKEILSTLSGQKTLLEAPDLSGQFLKDKSDIIHQYSVMRRGFPGLRKQRKKYSTMKENFKINECY
uniref:Uncharacterized protein n=1 Tax=Romanomermis culicivorax TaxID=13658 RepID=A0A915HXH6_ROMCU